MRRDDDPQEAKRYEQARSRRWWTGLGLLVFFTLLFFFAPRPGPEWVTQLVTIGGAILAAHIMDEKVTGRYLDRAEKIMDRFLPGDSDGGS